MPFGLELKSFVIGALFAYYLLPWLLGKIFAFKNRNADA